LSLNYIKTKIKTTQTVKNMILFVAYGDEIPNMSFFVAYGDEIPYRPKRFIASTHPCNFKRAGTH
jgi:hypothetical protein